MLADLLWFLGAKQQYNMQKAQGLAGLIGILSVVFFVWKWEDWFYPAFDKIGLIDIAENTGLVSELDVLTVINVIAFIFFLCLFFACAAFSLILIGSLFMLLGSSKLGKALLMVALTPLFLVIALFTKVSARESTVHTVYNKDPKLRTLLSRYRELDNIDMLFNLYIHQCKREDHTFVFSKKENWNHEDNAETFLNRALSSVRHDTNWLLAYHKALKKLYILFPNPLPRIGSRAFDEGYQGDGLYGFLSHANNSIDWLAPVSQEKVEYFVPALPIDIAWNGEKIHLKADTLQKIEAINVYDWMDIYYLRGSDIQNFYQSVLNSNNEVPTVLKRAHLAFYLLQIAYKENDEHVTQEIKTFLERCKNVPEGETFYPIYAADVQNEIINHAKSGEAWAIRWFNEVN